MRIILFFALLAAPLLLFAQDYEKKYRELDEKDSISRENILRQWEKASPTDPQMFISFFNFYIQKSIREEVTIDNYAKDSGALVMSDTGTGQAVAYINSGFTYNDRILEKAFEYIDRGIRLHPNRLDMRFGRIHMLGERWRFEEFTSEILAAIDHGNKINNAWLWKDGKPLDHPEQFFLDAMQTYVNTIYNAEDDSLLPLMRKIAERILQYHPQHVESLANVALTWVLVEDYDKGILYLLRAETIAPKDIIVLSNLAEIYKRKGNKARAKEYYNKVITYGNEDEAQMAMEKMKEL